MFSYLLVYIFFLITSFFCYYSKKINISIGAMLFPIIGVCIFSFGFRNYSVGTDSLTYIKYFYLDWKGYSGDIEPLYVGISNFFHFLFKKHVFFFLFEAFIIVICTFLISSKKAYFVCFPLSFILLYVPGLNIQRQVFCVSIILVILFKNRKYKIFDLLFLIICCFIHKSSFIFVLLYFFSRVMRISNRVYKLLFILFFITIYYGLFDKLLFALVDLTPYRGYLDFFYTAGSKKLTFSLLNFVKWGIYFYLFNYTANLQKSCLFNNSIFAMFISDLLVKQYPFLFRLAFLCAPMISPCMRLVCEQIAQQHKLKDKIFCLFVLTFYSLQFVANLLLGQNEVIPFKFLEL